MSTVKKGDTFENKVFNHFKNELKNDRLYVAEKTSHIFQKKSYYSKDREANVIIDISIETYLPKATDYSLLTVIECKDYNSSIPIDDIQELHDKVRQIAGDKGKAIFATTAALQKSALTYAKNNKIAIIRFLPSNQVNWVFYYMTSDAFTTKEQLNGNEFNSALLNQEHRGRNRSFYASYDNYIFGNLSSLLKHILNE